MNVGIFLLLAFLLLHCQSVLAQQMMPRPEDVGSVDAIIKAVYESVSFKPGQPSSWERLRSLFADGARMIPPQRRDTLRVLTVEEYITRSSVSFDRLGIRAKGFHELELARQQEEFGNIVHVWSTYETRHTAEDAQPFSPGINSIQLERHSGRWWVVTILWDAERPGLTIPQKYLQRN